jgi:Leucine-rich repeat (LRR) protein
MKKILLSLLFLSTLSIRAQYTLIPSITFEKKLITLGYDDVEDGKVLTSKIDKVTVLYMANDYAQDLTGIQDFVSLTYLDCRSNSLSSLDLSKNTALVTLKCDRNRLTSLDISKNINLQTLDCNENKITNLDTSNNPLLDEVICYGNDLTKIDVSTNLMLKFFNCSYNELTDIDVTKNIFLEKLGIGSNKLTSIDISKNNLLDFLDISNNKFDNIDITNNLSLVTFGCALNNLTSLDFSKHLNLKILDCSSNQLSNLNLKNGNNSSFEVQYSNFRSNSNLTCIQVDDVAYSNTNWLNLKDNTATYNSICPGLGIEESDLAKISVYPNPTNKILHIDNIYLEKASVYDGLGRIVKTELFNINTNKNVIDLSNLSKGIYNLSLLSNNKMIDRKIIIE